ncbi:hypothetical protein I8748_33590 [Nostoc sp. CENA67]|uniref:Beta/gamma crystallin 'Greek key' domain-containing protein n=1 Tax=Amazonocrinis nigriterrae CENA67 TaxID=2794033 RepID=A0A8J7HW77_9NOST|nr:hypothetical protein [Amazonocrinis nigriterrae]MBH8567026.1 hypothetical protein [Amazonocrinis nigriterrae CENA67]
MSKGNVEQFLEALGAFESGKASGDPLQYSAQNQYTNATGKYQFTEVIFLDLGYYNSDGNNYDGNFNGSWTGKNGVSSLDSWKAKAAVQETAIREAFNKNYGYVNDGLSNQGINSIDQYLANSANQVIKTVKFYQLNNDRTDFLKDAQGNRIINTQQVSISLSGILAGAHLRGGYGIAEILVKLNNQKQFDFTASEFNLDYYKTYIVDEINTPVFKYLNDFGGYDVKKADFSLGSYGNTTDYVLYGTPNNNTINGGSGNDKINGGSGYDSLIGGRGNDILDGGSGNDILDGGEGNDILRGTNQNSSFRSDVDTLTGRQGADTFVLGTYLSNGINDIFYSGSGVAHITDFNRTQGDKIQVAGNKVDYSIRYNNGNAYIYYKGNEIAKVFKNTNLCLASDFQFLSPSIEIFEKSNYQGKSLKLSPGRYDYNYISTYFGNDILSSLKVSNGLSVRLYDNGDFQGKTLNITSNTSYVGNSFNDLTSSIEVTPIF